MGNVNGNEILLETSRIIQIFEFLHLREDRKIRTKKTKKIISLIWQTRGTHLQEQEMQAFLYLAVYRHLLTKVVLVLFVLHQSYIFPGWFGKRKISKKKSYGRKTHVQTWNKRFFL